MSFVVARCLLCVNTRLMLLLVDCGLLRVVGCLRFVAWCVLFVVCGWLIVGWCWAVGVCCLLFDVVCCVLFVAFVDCRCSVLMCVVVVCCTSLVV